MCHKDIPQRAVPHPTIALSAKLHPGLRILQIDTRELAIQDPTIGRRGIPEGCGMCDDRMCDDRMCDDGMASCRMFAGRFQDVTVAL